MTSPTPGAGFELVRRSIVVVGTSAGGAALRRLVAGLPAGLSAASEALEAAPWAAVRALEESAQDVLLPGTTLDDEDVAAREGMLDS